MVLNNIFPGIPTERSQDAQKQSGHARQDPGCVQGSMLQKVRAFAVSKGRNSLEELCSFCNVGQEIQDVQQNGQPQSQSDSASLPMQEGREAKADTRQFQLQQQTGHMEQNESVPVRLYPNP